MQLHVDAFYNYTITSLTDTSTHGYSVYIQYSLVRHCCNIMDIACIYSIHWSVAVVTLIMSTIKLKPLFFSRQQFQIMVKLINKRQYHLHKLSPLMSDSFALFKLILCFSSVQDNLHGLYWFNGYFRLSERFTNWRMQRGWATHQNMVQVGPYIGRLVL